MLGAISSPSLLDQSVSRYKAISSLQKGLMIAASVTLVVSVAIGVLTYMALTKGLLPNHLSHVLDGAISAAAGSFVFASALFSIQFYYQHSIDKKREASHAALLMALIDNRTTELWHSTNATDKKLIRPFKNMLLRQYSDIEFQNFLRYLDRIIFIPAMNFKQDHKSQAFDFLCDIAYTRLLKSYAALKAINALSESASNYLAEKLSHKLLELPVHQCKELLQSLQIRDPKVFMPLLVEERMTFD